MSPSVALPSVSLIVGNLNECHLSYGVPAGIRRRTNRLRKTLVDGFKTKDT